ncbi:MAG: tRNA (guanosine(37)-N1)-methyltransferase TrmD [Dehalococcoidia bacterium]|nr:tRNA (guanosine(37)-N1)-methyltransferase TrmD [Dehalococcoidia bacterium]MDD5494789.1 tRNA (guanosine(37)-N1)-methyltransferase TrmD [Dehalococcoidia bacterium]
MHRIDVLTLFPKAFNGYIDHSILGRAQVRDIINVKLHDIRGYSHDKHHTVDDYPYGGGAGMIMKPEPIFEAIENVKREIQVDKVPVILLTPQGRLLNQDVAVELSKEQNLILICGHYEGIDERVAEHLSTDEISIGDYLLSGGETAAMVIIDCLVRLFPGAIGSDVSLIEESHVRGVLEYPQYTRPPEYRGWKVPEVLLSGNHQQISAWRREQSILRTMRRRPDLLCRADLSEADHKTIESFRSALSNN